MKNLNILYLGQDYGTSRHRADALRRLGHRVEVIDPWEFLPQQPKLIRKLIGKLTYEIGPGFLEAYVRQQLKNRINEKQFDIIWSNQCELMGLKTALFLKAHAKRLITYSNDDPFGTRDKKRFLLYRKAIGLFDLVAVVRQPNISEATAHGAPKVVLVPFTADEIAHAPLDLSFKEQAIWASDVVFIGTWMPERGSFFAHLLELSVPLTLYGNLWQKAPEWPIIKKAWRGPGLIGPAYVKAIQCAKICIGLLSKGNRDLSTRRSAEIPYIGGLLCAERTSEHLAMYKEDEEAVFWSTPEECAQKCFDLLTNDKKRKRIAEAGRKRCIAAGYLNEPAMQRILDALFNNKPGSDEKFPCKI